MSVVVATICSWTVAWCCKICPTTLLLCNNLLSAVYWLSVVYVWWFPLFWQWCAARQKGNGARGVLLLLAYSCVITPHLALSLATYCVVNSMFVSKEMLSVVLPIICSKDVRLVMCNNSLYGNLICCQLYIDFCCSGKMSVVLAMICCCKTKVKLWCKGCPTTQLLCNSPLFCILWGNTVLFSHWPTAGQRKLYSWPFMLQMYFGRTNYHISESRSTTTLFI